MEQVFLVFLTLVHSQDPEMVNITQNVSLGIIVDNDRKFNYVLQLHIRPHS